MHDWLIRALIILAVIGGLLVTGLAALFLIVRSARSRPPLSGGDKGAGPERPMTEDQARQIAAEIQLLSEWQKDSR